MFTLNGTPVSIDNPYTTEEGVTYPHLRDPSVRELLGVVEVADPEQYDQRFYWDAGIPKDLDQLKSQWIAQTKSVAGSLLAQTDWVVIRKAERGIDIPVDVAEARGAIILDQDSKQQAIEAATTVEELMVAVGVVPTESPAPIETPQIQDVEIQEIIETSQIQSIESQQLNAL